MAVLETLSDIEAQKLEQARDSLTLDMLDSLEYGQEVEINNTITLYKYCEEDIVVLNITDRWEEVLQVMWDDSGNIVFETL